jgi:polyhydroxyalkanoate synthesis regulator protein
LTVLTTSHQAIKAQENSNIAAIIIAQVIVSAFDQTAGQTLFATSFAHILIAIYHHITAASITKILTFIDKSKL